MNKLIALLVLCVSATTADATCTKPTISFPLATADSTGTQETITWTTDVLADSVVVYGLSTNSPTVITSPTDATPGVTSHTVVLTGLVPNTPLNSGTYVWGVRSQAIDAGVACGSAFYTFYAGSGSATQFTTAAPAAGTYDYFISTNGPHHVTQSYPVYFQLRAGDLVGTVPANNTLKVVITGLPNNVIVKWPDQQSFGQNGTVSTTTITGDTLTFYKPGPTAVEILTNQAGTTTAGSYTLTFTFTGAGFPSHSTTMPLVVDPIGTPFGYAFTPGTPSSYPAIPDLAVYITGASTYGAYNCAEDLDLTPRTIRANDNGNLTPVGSITKGAWFYDGIRVYQQIGRMLGTPHAYDQCIANINAVYRDGYVIPNSGAIFWFDAFTHGIAQDYLNTSDPLDLAAVNYLDAHTYSATSAKLTQVYAYQRELAYNLKADLDADLLGQNNVRFGQSTAFWLQYHKEVLLGQIDQICLTQNAGYYETFMAGLQADALITYYNQKTQDPRIPPAIKCLADYLYANAYSTVAGDTGAFQYDNIVSALGETHANAGTSYMVELNLLIAPMYAWVFKMTGDATYQTRGDTIWDYGVLMVGADGQGGGAVANMGPATFSPGASYGKSFSQNYMWSPSYVTWRSAVTNVQPANTNMFASLKGSK